MHTVFNGSFQGYKFTVNYISFDLYISAETTTAHKKIAYRHIQIHYFFKKMLGWPTDLIHTHVHITSSESYNLQKKIHLLSL